MTHAIGMVTIMVIVMVTVMVTVMVKVKITLIITDHRYGHKSLSQDMVTRHGHKALA